MPAAVIAAAVRTPIGRAKKGSLVDVRPDDLAAVAIRGVLAAAPGLDPATIENVALGCAFPEAEQGMNVAKIAAFIAGLPASVAGSTTNRFCGSAMDAVQQAARAIMAGEGTAYVAGGVESMSMVPMGGHKLSPNPGLMSSFPAAYMPMGMTAENVAVRYGLGRAEQDEFALASHQRALAAQDRIADELVAVPLPGGGEFTRDEGPRADTSLERLGTLTPAFATDGTVTAGNSSPLNDGAAAMLIMTADAARAAGLTPLAEVVSMAVAGIPPDVMGLGPIPASRKALDRAGLTIDQIDLVELNEAFASQSIAVVRDLEIPTDKLNVNGGALAIGHPLGMSGARLLTSLAHELVRRGGGTGLATMCIGGGQGIATVIRTF